LTRWGFSLPSLSPIGGGGRGGGVVYPSSARRVLHLIEPVEAHRFDDAVADHDQTRFVLARAEMLMDRERRDIDEIAPRPFGFARFGFPIPLIGVDAVEFEIPVQMISRAFGDEAHLFPHMAMLACLVARLQEQHIGIDAMLARAYLLVPQMLYQTVGRLFEGLIFGADHIEG